jgi:hypothetical protein
MEEFMRPFLAACLSIVIIGLGAWAVLGLVQEPVSKAFTTSAVRLDQTTPMNY